MIKTQFGNTTIKGEEHEVMADFSCIVRTLKECLEQQYSEDEAKAKILHAYERAFLTKDELLAEVEKSEKKAQKASKAIEALADLLEAIGIDLDEEGDEEDGSAE